MRRTARIAAGTATTILLAACSSGSTAPAAVKPRSFSARVIRETVVAPAFRQGVARDGAGWLFSYNDGLYRTDRTFAITRTLQPAIPAVWRSRGYDHIGDIDVVGNVVYAPLEQPNYALGHQAVLIYDATTLAYRSGFEIHQHENSFVTVDPTSHIAYSMDRFGGAALTRYDTAHHWKPLRPLRLRHRVEKVQGGDARAGAVWLSTDDATDGVYRVDLATGSVQALGSVGHVDGEGEGIDATPTDGADLHVLSIDVQIVPVRLVELRVTATTRLRDRPTGG